jgi:diguanylate cyclase (GGDEF)-like protein
MAPTRFDSAQQESAMRFAFVGNVVPIAIATATDFASHGTLFFVGAVGGCLAPLIVATVPRRHRIVFYVGVFGGIPALALMQAYTGGAASGYSVLMMMAMVWFGLQASDRELVVGLAVLAACSCLPMLLIGPPAYPVDWGHAALLILVGATVAGSLRAVTRETQVLTERLRREAVHDDLTGLLNRRGWREAAHRELAHAKRTGTPTAVAVIDLDDLKQTNDSMGHDAGDCVLRETAERMRAALRGGDVLARLGGDEFAALLTDATLDGVLEVVLRLRDVTPPLGRFSAGVAVWDGREGLDQLLRRCDAALYASKASGGGQTQIAPVSLTPLDTGAAPAAGPDLAARRAASTEIR